MEHHGGLFADISNSFPGNGGLPSTNVKYHLHNPPQPIPPQPPPPPGPTLGPLPSRQYHQYHHPHPQQQQQQQQQHQTGAQLHSHSQTASSGASQQGAHSSVLVGAYGQSIVHQHQPQQSPGIIHQSHVVQQQQQQQQPDAANQTQRQHHHLESALHSAINGSGNIFPDTHTIGLFGDTANGGQSGSSSSATICVNSGSSNSNSSSGAGVGNQGNNTTSSSSSSSSYSSSITNSSRKFETNTGDSITYNINNINTNIVNNISAGQGAPPAIAAISNGAGGTVDFLGGGVTAAQYGTGSSIATNGGSGGGSGGVPGASAPTIINISNNNHNIMAPPYPYHGPPQYQTKMASGGAAAAGATAAGGYKELGKYGTPGSTGTSGTGGGGWSEYATTHHHHEASVIGNFEAKNPNKYHHSTTPGAGVGGRVTGGYRYASEYLPSQQGQPGGMTAHYPTGGAGAGYGLYHPEGVQATPISPQTQPPSAGAAHPGYDPYPHIVRNKYPSGGGGQPPHMAGGSRPTPMASHPDLMYNERSQRYVNSYATGSLYMPSAGTAGSTGA
uniref:Uncharacterized protein n=2 Tax=Anopheles atroparvus TaxID=41427 RepID=A0AAG5CX74_ANOAO